MTAVRQRRPNGEPTHVFAIRLSVEERRVLEAAQARTKDGPAALGPWILWQAERAARLLPARFCSAAPAALQVVRTPAASSVVQNQVALPAVRDRVILDLCAGTGAWSRPYAEQGYRVVRVSLPELDVRTWQPPDRVWGVLGAPPCDQFSIARNGLQRDFLEGLEPVIGCLRIIAMTRPEWWALENPTGLLSRWLGPPRDVWEPYEFGDAWTKRTAIWGSFELPERGPWIEPVGPGPHCAHRKPTDRPLYCGRAECRAVTPPGFARAFAKANP